ncbi:MAG TPA: hypothetical protein VHR86_09430 [Armatimonadota bacterium]|nr:hypothetical protein [Armatimonadota bacterium]
MNIMVVEEGQSALVFVSHTLEALGAKIVMSPTLDEDKIFTHKVDAVLHLWSSFTADIARVQLQNMREADPNLVVILFARAEEVPFLRREFKGMLVADVHALEAAQAGRTAGAILKEVRARRPTLAAAA